MQVSATMQTLKPAFLRWSIAVKAISHAVDYQVKPSPLQSGQLLKSSST